MNNRPVLSENEARSASLASSQAVTNAFSSLKAHFINGYLLPRSNPYYYSPRDSLKEKWRSLDDQFQDQDLLQYLSASVLVHAYDGWAYLAQAMQAMIRGDLGAVRHLAYYAELRAALSILSSQGIGIYGDRNVIVDSTGTFHKYSTRSTHTIAWLSLEEWSKSSSSGALFGDEIIAFSRPLRDWLCEFERTPTPRYTGASLINKWGVDLKKYSSDKDSRNEVSYQVNLSHTERSITPKEFYDLIKELWESTDPSVLAFSTLDNFLLKNILLSSYKDRLPIYVNKPYEHVIAEACQNLEVGDYAKNFLQKKGTGDNPLLILKYAGSDKSTFDDHQFLDMFSRAFLLLRLAAACVSRMLKDSGTSMDDFEFWWHSVAYSSGLAEEGMLTGSAEEDIENFWHEVEDAIDELEDRVDEGVTCWRKFMKEESFNIEPLSRLEKIAFFGMSRA